MYSYFAFLQDIERFKLVGAEVGALVDSEAGAPVGAVVGASVAVVSALPITAGRSSAIRQTASNRLKSFLFIINTPYWEMNSLLSILS